MREERRPSIQVATIRDSEGSIVAVVKRNDMIEFGGGAGYPYVVIESGNGENAVCVPLDRIPDLTLALLRSVDIKMPE